MKPAAFAALSLLALPVSAQVPLDLSSWSAESYPVLADVDPAAWTIAAGGGSATQTANGQPTLFFGPFELYGTAIDARVVAQDVDDDFIGFALGFRPGDTANPAADYLLVDWKRTAQGFDFGAPSCSPGTTAPEGLAVSRVRGVPTADELWGHVDLDVACSGPGQGVTELARAANLGSQGWTPGTDYEFRFVLTSTQLRVFVDGVLEIDLTGSFSDGRFACYDLSQADATFGPITAGCEASWSHYGTGLAGTLGVPSLALSGPPVLGSSISFELTSSSPVPSIALVAYGSEMAILPTPFGGTLWLAPVGVLSVPLPPGTSSLPFDVPPNPALCATASYFQFAQKDVGAVSSIAFSAGLEAAYGL